RIDLLFFVEPQGQADRAQQLFGKLALRRADLGRGKQTADALAQQGWGIGHAAHDGWRSGALRTQPVGKAGAAYAGGDRYNQLMPLEVLGQVQADRFHHLGFERQNHDIGFGDGGRVVGERFDAVLGVQAAALLYTGVTGADMAGRDTLGEQAADQAGGHVAGADKGYARRIHRYSLRVRGGVVAGAKQGGADAYPGGTFGNGGFQVMAHAHGQRRQGRLQVARQLAQLRAGGALLREIVAGLGDGHQTAELQVSQLGHGGGE